MRYLEIEELNSTNNLFNQFDPDDGTRFVARLEAYSCNVSLLIRNRQSVHE